jgi:hypothetical protein
MIQLTPQTLRTILNEVTGSPIDIEDTADLAPYIKDSIDLGEVLAVIKAQTGVEKELQEFTGVRIFVQFYEVLSA